MDKSKSLQELENDDWGEPDDAPTNLVRKCLTLRRVPLEQFSAEDCRLMLGQNIGARYVLPVALKFLVGNPMESGTMSEGALIRNVLKLPAEFWMEEQDLWWQVNEAVTELESWQQTIEEMTPEIEKFKTFQAE